MTLEELKPKIKSIISEENQSRDELLLKICEILEANIDYYNWVGFYFKNGDKD